MRRTRALLEGAGSWRAGDWSIGATLGFEARDHTTILSGVLRRNRLVTPGIVLGVARKIGGVDAGLHARYRYRSETIRVIEVSEEPHTGCTKFVSRFGLEAMKFVNSPLGRALNLRGINARVVRNGRIRVGDATSKLAR